MHAKEKFETTTLVQCVVVRSSNLRLSSCRTSSERLLALRPLRENPVPVSNVILPTVARCTRAKVIGVFAGAARSQRAPIYTVRRFAVASATEAVRPLF